MFFVRMESELGVPHSAPTIHLSFIYNTRSINSHVGWARIVIVPHFTIVGEILSNLEKFFKNLRENN